MPIRPRFDRVLDGRIVGATERKALADCGSRCGAIIERAQRGDPLAPSRLFFIWLVFGSPASTF